MPENEGSLLPVWLWIFIHPDYPSATDFGPQDLLFSKDGFELIFKALAKVKKADTDQVYRTFPETRRHSTPCFLSNLLGRFWLIFLKGSCIWVSTVGMYIYIWLYICIYIYRYIFCFKAPPAVWSNRKTSIHQLVFSQHSRNFWSLWRKIVPVHWRCLGIGKFFRIFFVGKDGHPHWLERCLDSTEPLWDQETDVGFMFFFSQMTRMCWKWLNYVELDIPLTSTDIQHIHVEFHVFFSHGEKSFLPRSAPDCGWQIVGCLDANALGDSGDASLDFLDWVCADTFFFVQGFDGVLMVCRTWVDIFSSYII